MILPILISVSVAPTSYVFCASAPPLVAMSTATVAKKATSRDWIAAISGLPDVVIMPFFDWKPVWLRDSLNTRCQRPARKNPATEIGGTRPSDKGLRIIASQRNNAMCQYLGTISTRKFKLQSFFTQPGSSTDMVRLRCDVRCSPENRRVSERAWKPSTYRLSLGGLFGLNSRIVRTNQGHRFGADELQRIDH